MESTSVYLISLYEILEAAGLEVFLVNPRVLKISPDGKVMSAIANGSNNSTNMACSGPGFGPMKKSNASQHDTPSRDVDHLSQCLHFTFTENLASDESVIG